METKTREARKPWIRRPGLKKSFTARRERCPTRTEFGLVRISLPFAALRLGRVGKSISSCRASSCWKDSHHQLILFSSFFIQKTAKTPWTFVLIWYYYRINVSYPEYPRICGKLPHNVPNRNLSDRARLGRVMGKKNRVRVEYPYYTWRSNRQTFWVVGSGRVGWGYGIWRRALLAAYNYCKQTVDSQRGRLQKSAAVKWTIEPILPNSIHPEPNPA